MGAKWATKKAVACMPFYDIPSDVPYQASKPEHKQTLPTGTHGSGDHSRAASHHKLRVIGTNTAQ